MGADASIFSQLRQQATQPGPLDQYAQMMSVKQLMGGNELQDLQRSKLTRDMGREEAFQSALADPANQTLSAADLMKKLSGIDYSRAATLGKTMLETDVAKANLEKTQTETIGAKAKQGRDLIASMTPENYADIVAQGGALKQQWAATAPAQFDPKWQRQHVMDADKFITQSTPKFEKVDVGGKIEMIDVNPFTNPAIKGTALDKTVTPGEVMTDKRTREEGDKNRSVTVRGQDMTDARTRDANAATQGAANVNTEGKLRDDFNKLSGDFVKVRDAHQRVLTSAKDPSAAGDLALIFNYMKVLDPGSTVREGEFATAQNSGGIPDRIRAQYNKAISGERLDDNIRKDFVDRSGRLYQAAEGNQVKLEEQFTDIARRSKADPQNVVAPQRVKADEAPAKPAAAAAPAAPKKGAQVDGYTYIGGDPANPRSWKKS